MYGFAPCSNGSRMFRPMVLPPASRAPRLAASMMPGPPPEVTTKRWFSDRAPCSSSSAAAPPRARPRRSAPSRRACASARARPEIARRVRCTPRARSVASAPLGALARVDARRPEEHDGVLNLLVLEAPERLEVLGQNPDRPPFRAFEKLRIEVRERLLRHNATATLSSAAGEAMIRTSCQSSTSPR